MISRPSAVLRLDGRAFDARQAALVGLRVELGLAVHDAATLWLAPSTPLDPQPGASLSVDLGERSEEQTVWTGTVIERADGPSMVTVEALAPSHRLSGARRAQVYVRQTVAQIVRDLVSAVPDVPLDTLEADLALDVYTVEPRRAVWDYVVELAGLADAVLSSTADGALRMVASAAGGGGGGGLGGALGSAASGALASVGLGGSSGGGALRRGAELLSWRLGPSTASFDAGGSAAAPSVAAVGAGSEQGATRWHWPRAAPTPVPAASTAPRLVGAVRTRHAAEQVAAGLAARRARAGRAGEIVAVGRPSLRPGQTVQLGDLPAGGPSGGETALRLESVEHAFATDGGFVTRARGVGDAASAGGGFGGLGALAGGLP